jgi:hypothetical protein
MKKLILIGAMVCSVARAEFMTGNELLQYVESSEDIKWGIAMGYVLGAADITMGDKHCTPNNVEAGQVLQIVKDKLKENPKYRHHSADVFVAAALADAWPCKKGRGA